MTIDANQISSLLILLVGLPQTKYKVLLVACLDTCCGVVGTGVLRTRIW